MIKICSYHLREGLFKEVEEKNERMIYPYAIKTRVYICCAYRPSSSIPERIRLHLGQRLQWVPMIPMFVTNGSIDLNEKAAPVMSH